MNRIALVSRPENSDELRRRILNTILAALVVFLTVIAVGCGGGKDGADVDQSRGTGNQSVGPRDTSAAGAEMPGGSSVGGSSMQAQTIDVTLKDNEIAMPTIIKPGPTTFNVTNAGEQQHNLEIVGNGHDTKLNADLDPGASGQLDVDLLPGTYRAYCPVLDHANKGMDLRLTVQP
jgi:uncharacterized cupredoxin-like copper-binding protein